MIARFMAWDRRMKVRQDAWLAKYDWQLTLLAWFIVWLVWMACIGFGCYYGAWYMVGFVKHAWVAQ
jgi:hypothetical protein